MSDLIDREAVREFIKSYSHSTDVVYHMEKHLYEVPTIDAVPVRHGEWILQASGRDCKCSVCESYWIPFGDEYDYKYCPNCGARMGERREG